MNINIKNNDIIITIEGFSLYDTLDCGQCFRFAKNADGTISGIAGDKFVTLKQIGDDVIFYNTTKEDFYNFWYNYFDFQTDYQQIKSIISADPIMKEAIKYAGGIRVLRQQPWETLCSFIISQNNNIPRIKGIIQRMCEAFGEKIDYNEPPQDANCKSSSQSLYSFPSYQRLAKCSLEDLSILRAGFRSKYILDAAEKVNSGEISLDDISHMEIDLARKSLMKIKGVGIKVAECALLFGFMKSEAFPVDVWIKRALDYFYKDGLPEFLIPYGGIVQQILFHYIRTQNYSI